MSGGLTDTLVDYEQRIKACVLFYSLVFFAAAFVAVLSGFVGASVSSTQPPSSLSHGATVCGSGRECLFLLQEMLYFFSNHFFKFFDSYRQPSYWKTANVLLFLI